MSEPGDPITSRPEPAPAAPAEPAPATAPGQPLETRGSRIKRRAHRTLLYTWLAILVAMLVILVAMIVSNTHQVRVNWVFGHSSSPLVWVVVISGIAGWVAGIATSILLRRRTRRPGP